jgi:hypothetical protein
MSDNASHPAEVLVYTVQGPEPCCRYHADKLAAIMRFMGVFTNEAPAPEGTQCNNCINEDKKGLK